MSKPITSALLLVLAVAASGLAAAEEITVCSSGCDYTVIQDAVDAAGHRDTIQLGAETFYENVGVRDKALTIRGAGSEHTIVEPGPVHWYFPVFSANTWLTLADMTIQNGSTEGSGGGVGVRGYLGIENCVIRNNEASPPGAIPAWGGGIAYVGCDLNISNSVISGNRTLIGGGIYINAQSCPGTIIIEDTAIFDNWASFGGGGVMIEGGRRERVSVIIRNSTIAGNSGFRAAGLFLGTEGSVTIENTTVADNTATHYDGGGMVLESEDVTITNTTIVGNAPEGLLVNAPGVRLRNTIVANNLTAQCSGTGAVSDGHNLFSDFTCDFAGETDLENTDPLVLPLADNGGLTWTVGLLPGSPAIDAGSRPCQPRDQRGAPRFDGDGHGGPLCDIGAFEYGPPPLVHVEPEDVSSLTGEVIIGERNRDFKGKNNRVMGGEHHFSSFTIKANHTLFVQPEQPLKIVAEVIVVEGTIDATGSGYPGSYYTVPHPCNGDASVYGGSGGGGYGNGGGWGGAGDGEGGGGCEYGTPDGPDIDMGAGGGLSFMAKGADGGGAVSLVADLVIVSGKILADGLAEERYVGGGAGGGILIEGNTVVITGLFSARGGAGGGNNGFSGWYGGGGAGGRIKVFYRDLFDNQGVFQVDGGPPGPGWLPGPYVPHAGGDGSIHFEQK